MSFSFSLAKNIHQYTYAKASTGIIVTQLTTATASTASGGWIDRFNLALNGFSTSTGTVVNEHTNSLAHSVKVLVPFAATLQTVETATVYCNLQDATSSTGAGAADYGSSTQSLTIGSTASTAAQTLSGCLQFNVDLHMADRFIRTQAHATVNTTATTSGSSIEFAAPVLLFGPGYNLVASTA